MQVAPEPVGLDLGGLGPDPVLGPPGVKTVPLEPSGRLGEGAEEGVDAEAVREQQVAAVAVVGDPPQIGGPDVLGIRDLGKTELREEPARRRPPLPEAPPHR